MNSFLKVKYLHKIKIISLSKYIMYAEICSMNDRAWTVFFFNVKLISEIADFDIRNVVPPEGVDWKCRTELNIEIN